MSSLKINFIKYRLFAAAFALFCALATTVSAQNTAFTFQGKLNENGAAANGQFDLEFKLYDQPAGGVFLGTAAREDVSVTEGIFTVMLDYGADVFYAGSGRYLEIGVRAGASSGTFTTINPRQELTASPYSIQAVRAEKSGDSERFAGLPPASFLRSNIDQNFSGSKLIINAGSTLQINGALVGDGALLSNLNATQILSGLLPDARLSANIPRLGASQVFTGLNVFNGGMSGNAAGLSNLNASNIASGTLADARLSANIPRLNGGNNFTAFNNFSNLSVGGGLPVTKILTGAATLDFGNERVLQEVLTISVPGARIGDAVYLGIPENVLPRLNLPANPPPFPAPATVVTQPFVFQAFVSAPDVVSVTYYTIPAPRGEITQSTCLEGIGFSNCQPPPGLFRVVVFSFAP